MKFLKYPKIHRLGKEEVEGILEFGTVTIQEKIDGANTSIWMGEDGKLHAGSRNRELGEESFNGFIEHINANEGIKKLLSQYPKYRLYGEWLVRHTIAYKETAYKQWYLFDIYVEDIGFLPQRIVEEFAQRYQLNFPQVFYTGNADEAKIKEYVGKSNLGDIGEGVVIKNPGFLNKFGDMAYAKLVTEKFKEDNSLTFGGNHKDSDTYWEMYVVNKYATLARVQKIMNKIQPEVNEKLDKQHTSRVAMTSYHDMITEEAWDIASKVGDINFKKLKGLCTKKFIKIYHDVLDGHISVAYEREQKDK